jgi:hypothetical protein
MKKLLIVAVILLAGLGVCLAAEYTNQLGQVFTRNADGTLTPVSSLAAPSVSPVSGQMVIVDTNAFVATASYTPAHYGDILIGSTTGKVWIAKGLTTASWVILN